MTLKFDDGQVFAQGACPYTDHHPKDPPRFARVVIEIGLAGGTTPAVVDTGGAFLILDPDLPVLLGLELGEPIESTTVGLRTRSIAGNLHKVRLSLQAGRGRGQSLEIEVTAFAPILESGEMWAYPTFLGLQGCLEFLRFAVDPSVNIFHFGAL